MALWQSAYGHTELIMFDQRLMSFDVDEEIVCTRSTSSDKTRNNAMPTMVRGWDAR
jgi:hypothetical protein